MDGEHPIHILELFDDKQFPASKAALVDHANDKDASRESISMLEALPRTEYETLNELNDDLGKIEKLPGQENLWPSQRSSKV